MEQENEKKENEEADNAVCAVRGLDLILKSIDCEKYKTDFVTHGINEHSLRLLTANDLRFLGVEDEDMSKMLSTINVLKKTLNSGDIRLSNDEILKLQSNICGHLGTIALGLNYIHSLLSNDTKDFDDVLTDNYLSSIDAAMMVKPYIRAEEKEIEKSLKKVYKIKARTGTYIIAVTVSAALLVGLALKRFNYIPSLSSYVHQMNSWRIRGF